MFMKNNGILENYLEMHPIGRNEGSIVMVVDKSSKWPLFDGGGQIVNDNEQVGGNRVAIEKPYEGPTNDKVVVESFDEERRYPTTE